MERNRSLIMPALILGAALVISTVIAAGVVKEVKLSNQIVSVKGYAEKNINADLAIWRSSFGVSGPALPSAYALLEKQLQTVLEYLKQQGIDKSQVEVGAVSTSPQYEYNEKGYSTGKILTFQLTQAISVTSNDVYGIKKIAAESTSLIKEDIGFSSNNPEFYYTKLDQDKIELLGKATQDANDRAKAIASASGAAIGPLRGASQGVFQITAPNSADVSDYGIYDTQSIEKTIKAVVTVRYSLQ